MKRWFVVGMVLVLLLSASLSFAASSATQTLKCFGAGNVCRITIAWTAHTDGSFTWSTAMGTTMATNIAKLADYVLYLVNIDPDGSTAPQALYDVVLTRTNTNYSYDALGSRGANLSATATSEFIPANDTGSFYPPIGDDTFALGISGNNVSGAKGVIRFWFMK